MHSNLNFDIDTESLLLEPINNFPCFSTAKQSVKLLLDNCESLASEITSVSSMDHQQFDICTPVKAGERYKDKARNKFDCFRASVDRLATKRVALREATDLLKQQMREFLDVPLVSRRDLMNLNY